MAAATAPDWLQKVAASENEPLRDSVERLRNYVRTEEPDHDYSRTPCLVLSTKTSSSPS